MRRCNPDLCYVSHGETYVIADCLFVDLRDNACVAVSGFTDFVLGSCTKKLCDAHQRMRLVGRIGFDRSTRDDSTLDRWEPTPAHSTA